MNNNNRTTTRLKQICPQIMFSLTVQRRCFFCGSFLLFVFRVCLCHTVLYVPCRLVDTCWGRALLLALLYVMFSCVFVTFPYDVLGQAWYLIVSIHDLCLLLYLDIFALNSIVVKTHKKVELAWRLSNYCNVSSQRHNLIKFTH